MASQTRYQHRNVVRQTNHRFSVCSPSQVSQDWLCFWVSTFLRFTSLLTFISSPSMLVHPTASPPLYISCMGFFNLFISCNVSTWSWADYSGLIISHRCTCSTFLFSFLLVYNILLYLSHFTNDLSCWGFRGKAATFGTHSH